MNKIDLLELFGEIDDNFILDAAIAKPQKVIKFINIKKLSLVACICLMIVAVLQVNNIDEVNINEIRFPSNASSVEYFNPLTHQKIVYSHEQTIKYFGIDYEKLKFQPDFILNHEFVSQQKILKHIDGEIVQDVYELCYINSDSNFILSVSKIRPFEMSFDLNGDRLPVTSKIYDRELYVFEEVNTENFYAYFEIDNTYYAIKSYKLHINDFLENIKIIIKAET